MDGIDTKAKLVHNAVHQRRNTMINVTQVIYDKLQRTTHRNYEWDGRILYLVGSMSYTEVEGKKEADGSMTYSIPVIGGNKLKINSKQFY